MFDIRACWLQRSIRSIRPCHSHCGEDTVLGAPKPPRSPLASSNDEDSAAQVRRRSELHSKCSGKCFGSFFDLHILIIYMAMIVLLYKTMKQ